MGKRQQQAEREELLRQADNIRFDKYEINATISDLYDDYDICPEHDEDAIMAEINAKQALYRELTSKQDKIHAKLDATRHLC